MEPALFLFQLIQLKHWSALVHLTRWLSNNYKEARSGRLLCIGIKRMALPPSNVFHTSSCWVKRYFTPLAFAEQDVHTEVDGLYHGYSPVIDGANVKCAPMLDWGLEDNPFMGSPNGYLPQTRMVYSSIKFSFLSCNSCRCVMHFPKPFGHTVIHTCLVQRRLTSQKWPL